MTFPQSSQQWSTPPDSPVLAPDEAHVWRFSLDALAGAEGALAATLSADERQRAERFHFETHRRQFVLGRGVLRSLLGQYLGRAPADLRFVYGPQGKPALADPPSGDTVFFNFSRSDNVALYAVTRAGEIGLDVEAVRSIPEWREIAQRLTTTDREIVTPLNLAEFFREWTKHEARVKAAGVGLGGVLPGERKWTVHSLPVDPSWAAAVALPNGVRRVLAWNGSALPDHGRCTESTIPLYAPHTLPNFPNDI